jgi:alpha-tubulin suppressor-like RCC1 family protein
VRRLGKNSKSLIFAVLVGALVFVGSSARSIGVAAADGSHGGSKATSASTTPYQWGKLGGEGPVLDSPTAISGVSGTITQLATSNSTSYALTSDGNVWAWGQGTDGQLGNGGTDNSFMSAVKVVFPSGVSISQLANPEPLNSGLAIDSTGHVWGWGYNANATMCEPGKDILTPKEIPGLSDVTLATGQDEHSLFDTDGKVVACGVNTFGELGDGTTKNASVPVAVVGLPHQSVISLQSSWHGSGALMANGSYYDWGFNKDGQMGLGNRKPAITTAQRVTLEASVVQVFQGGSHPENKVSTRRRAPGPGQTIALLSNGTVWNWGSGHFGQLGDGNTVDSGTPVQVSVPNGVTFVQVASGGATSYAIDSHGTMWSWGSNRYGALGNGSTTGDVLTPTAIAGGPFTYVTTTASSITAY